MKHNYTSSFQRMATNGGGIDLRFEIKDCWGYDKEIPESDRFLGSMNSLKIVVTAPTKQKCFDEILTSIKVMMAYQSGIDSNGLKSLEHPLTGDDTNAESQKQILIDIMDEDQKDGLYDDITIPKELDDWAIATAMDSFQDAVDKPIMDILLRGTFYRGECAAIQKLMPEIERWKASCKELNGVIDAWKKEFKEKDAEIERLKKENEQLNVYKHEYNLLKEAADGLSKVANGRLKKALQQIEQMSDPGDYEKAIVDMKSIASNALKNNL